MKIYDLDYLDTISDDVAVFGGSEINVNLARSSQIGNHALSLSKYNRANTVSFNTGIVKSMLTQRLNFINNLSKDRPSLVRGINKIIKAGVSMFKPNLVVTKIISLR
ncbi:hypothetical protein H6G41_01565 [Tolypothrix sp. FACHB-123]|uniref:hypothetical protein n=1 Tax=Tolypothrix sp. FACHB-123 TaxID=2692868 RepID=UPI0016858A32|nr:hypothetical protein [Tolypothrix sp. FACHB-123]MBD2353319.1 hypothetical protein [Tolypothrix sp. FACHB-123]